MLELQWTGSLISMQGRADMSQHNQSIPPDSKDGVLLGLYNLMLCGPQLGGLGSR